ncbi:MAG: DNA helicase RecQ [Flavobacteriales bacterium]|nr:DNA helicase RecQ [Flavobacteriales bacterium]
MNVIAKPEEILKRYFGYSAFRGFQKPIIETVLAGKDVLVLMPTGGGKSICYQIPALLLPGLTIVVSPLISLMKDQVFSLQQNGIPAAYLNSSLSPEEEQSVSDRIKNGELKLLFVSPERVLMLKEKFWSTVTISLIAIDEAHCVSQWGQDFRPEYARLHTLRQIFPNVTWIALTATADHFVKKDIMQLLGLKNPELFVASFDRPNISLTVKSGLKQQEKMTLLISFLAAHRNESGIIFCQSRKIAEDLSLKLQQKGIRNLFYHAGMEMKQRSDVQDAFINDEVQVICATVAFGMGIDKSNVRWVAHFNLPKNLESYYQEIGRAGRDGLPADTLLLYGMQDIAILGYFAARSSQSEFHLEKLARMQYYAESSLCRRKVLLAYFGESFNENCGRCDICLHPPLYSDCTEISTHLFNCIQTLGEQVSSGMLTSILRGNKHADLIEKGFHLLSFFGSGTQLKAEEWQQLILQLTGLGYLLVDFEDYHKLKLTRNAREILKGYGQILLPLKIKIDKKVKEEIKPEQEVKTKEEDAFVRLKKLRLELARKEKVAPYIVFHDKTLHELLDQKPSSREHLLSITGISQRKLEKYGDVLLEFLSGIQVK